MAKQPKLVRQDAEGIWLALSLAAGKAGLTKSELIRRADADNVRFQPDKNDKPAWFFEPEITTMARQRRETEIAKPVKQTRKPTDAQLEARMTRQWKEEAKTRRYGGGPLGAHADRVMLYDIEQNNAKRKKDEQGG